MPTMHHSATLIAYSVLFYILPYDYILICATECIIANIYKWLKYYAHIVDRGSLPSCQHCECDK